MKLRYNTKAHWPTADGPVQMTGLLDLEVTIHRLDVFGAHGPISSEEFLASLTEQQQRFLLQTLIHSHHEVLQYRELEVDLEEVGPVTIKAVVNSTFDLDVCAAYNAAGELVDVKAHRDQIKQLLKDAG